jgi:hypothetical protein
LAQLFGIHANKGRLTLSNHQHHSNTSTTSLSTTLSLPFDTLFNTEKGVNSHSLYEQNSIS